MMQRKWYSIRQPVLLFLLVVTADLSMFAYLRFVHSPGWPSDALAHTLNARMIIENLTPGFSQLGFWPPVLHLLLLPAASIQIIYRSDLAGFITLLPVLYAAVWFLNSIVGRLTGSRALSWLAVVLFLMNPYILYFSVAAMTEIVFLAAYLGFVYAWLRWAQGDSDFWILCSACLVSIMFLSRYEGILMIPLSTILFFLSARHRGIPWRQMVALLFMCALLSSMGLLWVFAYGLYYVGDPLAFLSIGVRSSFDTALPQGFTMYPDLDAFDTFAFAWNTGVIAAKYLLGASFLLFGSALGACALFAAVHSRIKLLALSLAAFPFISIVVLIGINRATVIVPELGLAERFGWPVDTFVNTRYLLPTIVFPIVGAVIFLGSMHSGILSRCVKIAVSLVLLFSSLWHTYSVIAVNSFRIIQHDVSNTRAAWSIDQSSVTLFEQYYTYGFILLPRYFSEAVMTRSRIPISAYIHESTYQFFYQAMYEPWLFARMVAVPLFGRGDDTYQLMALAQTKEFRQYYSEAHRDSEFVIYLLNEQEVRRAAQLLGYDVMSIPSLDSRTRAWDPDTIYQELLLNRAPAAMTK